ncbi:MAG: LPS export ABC transporter periplasmic protein LptC [Prevotellaceae bacterium]|nr:LPS export ABC transporter periplasmic protein LptC [Prevotellaceae bacterium]
MRLTALICALALFLVCSCESEQERVAEAVDNPDSVAFMRSRGISSLISDSGVLRYKLTAEEWDIYTNTQPATWKFMKGLLMQRFDQSFQIDLYVQADTAYLHEQRTWELRGRVAVRNIQGTIFLTEELFWDMNDHQMWNNTYMHIITPERELEGTDFRSNEQMTDYYVSNSVGKFPISDTESATPEEPEPEAEGAEADSLQPAVELTPAGQRAPAGRKPAAPNKQKNEQAHFK